MGVQSRHIFNHGPVLSALGRAALSGLGAKRKQEATVPGPEFTTTVRPLPAALINEFVRHLGGDPRAYRGQVPPHLFPQWAFPVAARGFQGLSYPMLQVVNGGASMRVNAALPSGVPLQVSGRLESVEEKGSRAHLKARVVTGTSDEPEALVTEFYALVPTGKREEPGATPTNGAKKKKDRPSVPIGAREIARHRLRHNAGLEFAKLTGDFNPIHWVPAYAKASGFRDVILHGFGTLARATESLRQNVLGGDIAGLSYIDVKFVRPLVLPASVGVFVNGDEIFVGDLPGGPAYMTGTFQIGAER